MRTNGMIGYGEDALTMWALKHRLGEILKKLNDSPLSDSQSVFYRPSFGRHGGDSRSEFGEFDFILLTDHAIYLGESKWQRLAKNFGGEILNLRPEQLRRHEIMKWYIKEWISGGYSDWEKFYKDKDGLIKSDKLTKPMPPVGCQLATNLTYILKQMSNTLHASKHASKLEIVNVLLYLHTGMENILKKVNGDFKIVNIDYSADRLGNFIPLE